MSETVRLIEIVSVLESLAPPSLQESYDNAGIQVKGSGEDITAALVCVDITPEVLEEASAKNCNLVISHHPLIFQGLKHIAGKNEVERMVIQAIQNRLTIYSAHTNLDAVWTGVNRKICDKLGLKHCEILDPSKGLLFKLVTFVPKSHEHEVREAVFLAGAGHIGEYDCCSYNIQGKGTFRGLGDAKPFVGKVGEIHFEDEIRLETILPGFLKDKVIKALLNAHPYEEVAYDLYALENAYNRVGIGMIGELDVPMGEKAFLDLLKERFDAKGIRHSAFRDKPVNKIAVCGGSGSFLIGKARHAHADVFVTGDVKYHQFFDAGTQMMIADIGHYESEQFTKEIFYEELKKKFPKFAIHFSEVNTNPINYY